MTKEEVHRTDPSEGVDTPSAAPTTPTGKMGITAEKINRWARKNESRMSNVLPRINNSLLMVGVAMVLLGAWMIFSPFGMVGNRGNSSELPEGAVSEEKKK